MQKKRKTRAEKATKFSLKKKLLLLGSGFFCLLIVIGAAGYFTASRYLNINNLVDIIEKKYNCRVEIGDLEFAFKGVQPTVILKQIKINKRDSFAKDGTPHNQRPALKNPILELGSAAVSVDFSSALMQKIELTKLHLDQLKANTVYDSEGNTELSSLFVKLESDENPKESPSEKDQGKTFNAFSNSSLIAKFNDIKITNSEIKLHLESSAITAQASNINIALKKPLELNIGETVSMTPAEIEASVDLAFFSHNNPEKVAVIELTGSVNGIFFNKTTGDFSPDLDLMMQLGKESYMNRLPLLQSTSNYLLGTKKLAFLKKLNIKNLKKTTFTSKDRSLNCHWLDGQIKFTKELAMTVSGWQFTLAKESWLQTKSNEHQFNYTFIASEEMSQKAKAWLQTSVEFLPKKAQQFAKDAIENNLFAESQLLLNFSSHGSFSQPRISLNTTLPNLKEIGRKHLREKGQNLLKSLLD